MFESCLHPGPQLLYFFVQRGIGAQPGQHQTELIVFSHTPAGCLLHIFHDHVHGTALQQIVHAAHEKYELHRSRHRRFPQAV